MLQIIEEIISIIFMLTLMFIGIWGFVIVIKMYNQLKYRNYILEKLSQNVYMITAKIHQIDGEIHIASEDLEKNIDNISNNVSQFKK